VGKTAAEEGGQRDIAGPRSLTRLLGLFDALAKSAQGLSLAELNTTLKSPKSSLLNLLRPLVAEGYLNHEHGLYRLGPAIFRLASSVMSTWNFKKVIHPYLEELAHRSGESVYLGVLDRESKVITYVDSIDSPHLVKYSVPVGAARPLYCTAAGRVLLAFASPDFQEDYLRSTKLEARTPRTISSRKALTEELHRVLTTRISISVGEMFPEAAAISAPVFGADGQVMAAIAVGGPAERLLPRLEALRPIITQVATRASGLSPATHRGASGARAAMSKRARRAAGVKRVAAGGSAA
jgi:DNA-binding IclR family transcriptional regulator